MKKAIIGIITFLVLLIGVFIWQGETILEMFFYDMDATMDLPENLYDDESLTNPVTEE